jgi:hypothetical protein
LRSLRLGNWRNLPGYRSAQRLVMVQVTMLVHILAIVFTSPKDEVYLSR